MDNDDLPVGQVLSRREALKLLSAVGATVLTGCNTSASRSTSAGDGSAAGAEGGSASMAVPACIVRPELIEGPYFADVQLDRSDIRSEPSTGALLPGVPLALTFNVSQISGGRCAPLAGAMVDIWQCDAKGDYSAFEDRRAGFDTRGQAFLRGYQVTDSSGAARFTTIYPGWYTGRAVHIHFKIRTDAAPGQAHEFTSQLFFDEALTDQVHARPPYAARGRRDTRNETDRFFRQAGDQLRLALASRGEGFDAAFGIGLDLTDAETGGSDRWRGFPGGRPQG